MVADLSAAFVALDEGHSYVAPTGLEFGLGFGSTMTPRLRRYSCETFVSEPVINLAGNCVLWLLWVKFPVKLSN